MHVYKITNHTRTYELARRPFRLHSAATVVSCTQYTRVNTSRGSCQSDALILIASLRPGPALRCSIARNSNLQQTFLDSIRLDSNLLAFLSLSALLRIRRSAPEFTLARLQLRNSGLVPRTRHTHQVVFSSPSPTVRFLESFVA